MSPIPGGRGPRHGPDASVNQRESDAQRALQLPGISGMYYANDVHSIGIIPNQATTPVPLGYLLLSPARPPPQSVDADVVGCWTGAVGGDPAILDVALYAFSREESLLTLLVDSQARMIFTGATLGNRRVPLARKLRITSLDSIYYFACRTVTNELDIWGAPVYLGGVDIFIRALPLPPTSPLPGTISLAAAPHSVVADHPIFGYFSNAWNNIL